MKGPGSLVIIGAGPAGVNVADTLRGEGYAGRIVILTSENDLPGRVLAVATIGRDLVSLGVEDALERGDWSKLEKIIGGNKTGPAS